MSRAAKKRRRRSRRPAPPTDQKRPRTWIGGISAAALAALVVVAVNLTSIIDWVERRVDPPKPSVIDTRLLDVRLKRTLVPLAEYLRDTRQSLEGLSAAERREPGLVFTVRLRLEGVVGKEFPLLWTLADAEHGRPVPDELYRQEAATFEPAGVAHGRTWPIWVPYPPKPGRYRLDLVLADEKHQPVDERSSASFRLPTIPAVE